MPLPKAMLDSDGTEASIETLVERVEPEAEQPMGGVYGPSTTDAYLLATVPEQDEEFS